MLFIPIHSEKHYKGAVAVSYTMEKTGNLYPLKEKHTLKKRKTKKNHMTHGRTNSLPLQHQYSASLTADLLGVAGIEEEENRRALR